MMRAITVREPWATAIVWGTKRLENHPYSLPRQLVGAEVAIHSGLNITTAEWDAVAAVIKKVGERTVTVGGEEVPFAELLKRRMADVSHRGCIIGTTITRETIGGMDAAMKLGQQQWFRGPLAHVLGEVSVVDPPVPARGQQRYWKLTPQQFALVQERVRPFRPGEIR